MRAWRDAAGAGEGPRLTRFTALGQLALNQAPQIGFEGAAGLLKGTGDVWPRGLPVRLQDGGEVLERGVVTRVDRVVRKPVAGAPRERMGPLTAVVTELETRQSIRGVKPDDEFQSVRFKPAASPARSFLPDIFDFSEHCGRSMRGPTAKSKPRNWSVREGWISIPHAAVAGNRDAPTREAARRSCLRNRFQSERSSLFVSSTRGISSR